MDDNITLRLKQLSDLQEDIKDIDKDITLILQSLQWDRKQLLESKRMVTCKYDCNHQIPEDSIKEHEEKCFLKSQGYDDEELFLPEPLDPLAKTVVKFSPESINDIISYAMKTNPLFKRILVLCGPSYHEPECIINLITQGSKQVMQREHGPLSLSWLQTTFTADERRALHDAVVSAAPSTLHTDDLDIPGSSGLSGEGGVSGGSRLQQLAAVRDAHRRRVKHRRAVASYRDELRAVIDTQMDMFFGQQNKDEIETSADNEQEQQIRKDDEEDNRRNERENGNKYLKTKRNDREDYRDKRRCENDRECRDRGDRREKRSYNEHDDRGRHKDYVKIKQEKDVENDRRRNSKEKRTHENDRHYRDKYESGKKEKGSSYNDKYQHSYDKGCVKIKQERDEENDGRSGNSREDHRKRKYDNDREYRDKYESREKEKRDDHKGKYQRYNDGGYIKIKKEKDVDYDTRSREDREHRDRRSHRDRDKRRHREEEYHRHEASDRRREKSGDSSRHVYDRGGEGDRVKQEPAWDGYEH